MLCGSRHWLYHTKSGWVVNRSGCVCDVVGTEKASVRMVVASKGPKLRTSPAALPHGEPRPKSEHPETPLITNHQPLNHGHQFSHAPHFAISSLRFDRWRSPTGVVWFLPRILRTARDPFLAPKNVENPAKKVHAKNGP